MPLEISQINTPQELYNFIINNIQYGIKDKNKIYQNAEIDNNIDKWHLNISLELLNNKYGLCFDYVELERTWFQNHNYEYKTIFLIIALDHENNYSTHSTLIYKENNKWYNFEIANYYNEGIHEYNTYEEAIEDIKNKHLDYNKMMGKEINKDIATKLKVFEYPKLNNNYNFNDYIEYIINNGKEIKVIL